MARIARNFLNLNKILSGATICQKKVIVRRQIHFHSKLLYPDNGPRNATDHTDDTSLDINHNLTNIVPPKFKIFRDEDAPIIFDVDEEREKINLNELNVAREESNIFDEINLEHGIRGVYDIEDLVDLLRRNNVMDIFVASVPVELVYVDYIVVVSGRSPKHMKATAEIVRRVFKKKRRSGEVLPKIEGKSSKDWIAMDLGNIGLHIFSQQSRKVYDLETLWSVGSEYDDQSNVPVNRLAELFETHSYLSDLEPAVEISN